MSTRDVQAPELSLADPHDGGIAASGGELPSPGAVATARRARARGVVKILFFAANAVAEKRLAVDAEYRAVEHSLRLTRFRDRFQLIPKLAARAEDLQPALREHRPDIVHFACHGSAAAELLLAAADGGAAPIPVAALAAMFRVLRDNLSLVVFNACWSQGQAAAIRQSAGLCIGMGEPIGDEEAIRFATALYGALGDGYSVRAAFDLGAAAIKTSDELRPEVPQLLEAHANAAASMIYAAERRTRPRWRLVAAGGAAVMVLAGSLWVARSGAPARSVAAPPPPTRPLLDSPALMEAQAQQQLMLPAPAADMVRFAASTLPSRRLNLDELPAACANPRNLELCAEVSAPSPQRDVEAFDLDRNEVTNSAFARWLNARATTWRRTKYEMVELRQPSGSADPASPKISLVRVVPECGGGLLIREDGQAVSGPNKKARPVTCVTWQGAREYCRTQGKRLPLEAEWDLASQGLDGRLFPWGNAPPRPDVVAFGADGAREVGASPQDVSPQGVHDLGGNVAEWVDHHGEALEPKMIRGGTWASVGPCNLLGVRCKRIPAESNQADVGFRCARSVTGLGPSPTGLGPGPAATATASP